MIGNAQEAEFIRDWYMEYQNLPRLERDILPDAPEGWERLGSGCYRTVFLAPSGVAYKVQRNYPKDGYYSQSNIGEAATIRRLLLRKLPKGCRFPRYTLFELDGRAVIAMERFKKLLKDVGTYSDEGRRYHSYLRSLQDVLHEIWDFHGANLAIDEENKLLVPIDLGGASDY